MRTVKNRCTTPECKERIVPNLQDTARVIVMFNCYAFCQKCLDEQKTRKNVTARTEAVITAWNVATPKGEEGER